MLERSMAIFGSLGSVFTQFLSTWKLDVFDS